MPKACVVEEILHRQFRDKASEVLGTEGKNKRVGENACFTIK